MNVALFNMFGHSCLPLVFIFNRSGNLWPKLILPNVNLDLFTRISIMGWGFRQRTVAFYNKLDSLRSSVA